MARRKSLLVFTITVAHLIEHAINLISSMCLQAIELGLGMRLGKCRWYIIIKIHMRAEALVLTPVHA